MNKTKKKPTKTNFPWRRMLVVTGIAAGCLLLLGQLTLDRYFFRWSAPSQNTAQIVSLITTALRGFHKPAVIEPISKKVYLPDASLVLPPYPTAVSDILYGYTASFDKSDAEVSVTLDAAMNSAISKMLIAESNNGRIWTYDSTAVFDTVPNAQACSRGVHVVFGSKTTYDHLEFSKQLADGRTMHIYTEAHSCAYNLQPLVEYLKQAQSY